MAQPSIHIRGKGDKPIYKIIIIGDPTVGKTSLIQKFVKHQVDNEYLPTVGASISKQPATVTGKDGSKVPISLLIWDVAGQAQFNLLHKVYYKGAHGVVIVFDQTKPETLESIKNRWYPDVVSNELSNVPRILVGNKSDLTDQIKVSSAQIDMIKLMANIPDYYDTSALNGQNVDTFFNRLAMRIYYKTG